MSRSFLTLVLLSLTLVLPLGGAADARDWRAWPFSRTSPWNMPIGSAATYAPIAGLEAMGAGLNFNDRWTSAVIISTDADPLVHVLVNASFPTSNWMFLAQGHPNCGNTPTDEAAILAYVQATPPHFTANPWSSLSTDEPHRVLPAAFHDALDHARTRVHLKRGACPSPDADGLMADFQPDGWVLDTYATIVLANGDIVTDGLASFVDAKGDGTGWWNGRRASMIPSFAGLIRDGELARGHIPHALAAVISTDLLTPKAVWPAYAFDRHTAPYKGTIPMGALLALPPDIDVDGHGLSPAGLALAHAAQDYGVYVVDSTTGTGITLMAQLGDPDIRWAGWQTDVAAVLRHLRLVTNNSAARPGGGGTRRAGLAPDFDTP